MPSSPLRGLPREVGVLVAVAFAVAVGFGIVAPAIPLFARHFGVGRTAAGAVISIFAAMRLVSAFGAGKLVDRLGERRILALGIGLVAVSSALAGLANSYVALLVLRGVGGLGSALFSISATSLLLRSVPAENRGRATGLFQGGFLLGGITGPAFGGLVTGISIRAPFFLYAATLAVAGSIGLAALPRTAVGARPTAVDDGAVEARTTLGQALRLPAYRAALVANLADSWAALGVRSALVPLFVGEVLGRSPLVTGLGFVVVAAVNGAVLLPRRLQNVQAINFFDAGFGNAKAQGLGADFIEQAFALFLAQQLGIGQALDRFAGIQHDGSCYDRPGQRPTAGLIHTGHQTGAGPVQAQLSVG